ncbi:MAG: hypothetical protein ACRD16_11030 [Thermoanaerobaculia bacterium]
MKKIPPLAASLSLALLAVAMAPGAGLAQEISNLEAGRPVTLEDPVPVSPGSYSGSFDYAYAVRYDHVDYAGPGFSLVYGFAPGFEIGGETRLLTNPRLNSRRGIGSGDLDLHVLGEVVGESEGRPGIALRLDALLATGFASHGTNFVPELLLSKSFDTFRIFGNFSSTYIGSTRPGERRNRVSAVVGIAAPPGGGWNTDTLALVDVYARQSVEADGKTTVGAELGVKRRIGMQTIFYAGMLSEVAGERTRIRYRGLLGLTHSF